MPDFRPISKALSYWLRHKRGAGGLTLDPAGWASTQDTLAALGRAGLPNDVGTLKAVIAENEKQRFELSEDETLIRARQGHSVAVDLEWPVVPPPEVLFHGTVERFLPAILSEGLKPMKRHHVHLSPDSATARAVGARRGDSIVVAVAATRMSRDGHVFRLTSNNVWLAEAVPPSYLIPLSMEPK